jgi:hypothetical protein
MLLLTSGVVIIGHAQPADPNRCLIFSDSLQNSAAIDLYTGATIGFVRHYPQELVQSVYQSEMSPDGVHLAYSRYDESLTRVQLFIKATDRIGVQNSVPVQSMVGAVDFAPYNPPRDFVWSPDGQWLAYWWQIPSGEAFLGIADPLGHVLSTKTFWPISLSTAQSSVFFHGWSADSRYLALSVRDAASGQYTLSLWSAPTLIQVRDAPYTRLKDEVITPLSNPDQLARWSTHGHQIAYLSATADFRQLQFGIISPEHDSVLTPLPAVPKVLLSNGELPTFNWSPDDRHLVLIRISPVRHWLEVIDPVGQSVQVVSDQAMAMESVFLPAIYFYWSADSHMLFYAQMAVSSAYPGNEDIHVYYEADKHSTTLIADVYDDMTATSRNKYLLFKQSIWHNNIESITAVILKPATGDMSRIPNLNAQLATTPFYILSESNGDWLAIGDEFINAGSGFRAVGWFDVRVLNAKTGAIYNLQDTKLTIELRNSFNDEQWRFLAPDGTIFASVPASSDKVIFTPTNNDPQSTIIIYQQQQQPMFQALIWSPNDQQITVISRSQFKSNVDQIFSLAVVNVKNGQGYRIEPLPHQYYDHLTYAACR